MEYLNFDILISSGEEKNYPVRVLQSPAGEASAILESSFDQPEFVQFLKAIELIRGTSRGRRSASLQEINQELSFTVTSEVIAAQEVGRRLFTSLFPSEVLSLYRSSLDMAREQGKKLRIRLRFDPPELSILPWEFLYDQTQGDHVNLLRSTTVTRYLDLGRPVQPLQVEPPLRILGMVASPNDMLPLNTEEEQRRMQESIDHLIEAQTVELKWVEGQTWQDLNHAIETSGCHIFHFIGHGAFDAKLGEGVIALVEEGTGSANFLSATQLGRLFDAHSSLRLAIINACEGARSSENDVFSSVGATLVRRGIPAVVSMQYAITDQAAIEFSREFYDSLARGLPVDTAVQAARRGISMALEDSVEWGTPVLYLRAQDGSLFQIDHASAIFQRPGEAISPPPITAQSQKTAHFALDKENLKGLQILLRKVHQYWIQGVFEQSLYRALFIDLGMEQLQDAVESPWGNQTTTAMIERAEAQSHQLDPQKKMCEVFEEEGGSLLILGEPGSGKTTVMLDLARDLLDQASNDPSRPVPVVFTLSSWNPSFQSLSAWLVQELSRMYQIPKKIGQAWLAESRILPLLDGLDELGSSHRSACVDAINQFTWEAGLVGSVVCCRLKEYTELPNRLNLNSAVRLLPLSDAQVFDYLSSAAPHLNGFQKLLQHDSALRIDARSPLMLGLMCRAYQDIPPEQLSSERPETTAARRKQLMDAYVARMFSQAQQRRGL